MHLVVLARLGLPFFYPMLLDTAGFSKMVQWPSEVLSERTWLVMCLLVVARQVFLKCQANSRFCFRECIGLLGFVVRLV